MNFPLNFTFKVAALAPQFSVRDVDGLELCYVRQKLFNFKEHIQVFKDKSKKELITEIHADRIIDWSASYSFYDPEGFDYGSVRRKGFRSLWKSHYEVFEQGNQTYSIEEGNPFAKFIDGIVGEIPVIGFLTGYFFNPYYDVKDMDGNVCYTLYKKPSFFGRRFEMQETIPRDDDLLITMSLIMMLLLERRRG